MADALAGTRRLLAVVPARGGTKRLPRKNVLPLGGRPLIAWTIDAARASGVLDDVLVSTDDEEIAGVARQCGAQVPWLRPAALATDTAIYMLSPELVRSVAAGERIDMPILLEREIGAGRDVSIFPVHEYWLDIGRMDNFNRAQGEVLRS
jgi:NDP-sugar pyrophosphorylase family protein